MFSKLINQTKTLLLKSKISFHIDSQMNLHSSNLCFYRLTENEPKFFKVTKNKLFYLLITHNMNITPLTIKQTKLNSIGQRLDSGDFELLR